ncbi:hypothetical protein V6N13_073309 [Hibiscus sabdariffa]
MNPNEFRGGGSSNSVRSYMSLTHYNPYARSGSSSVAPQLVQPDSSICGSSIAVVANLGLPGPLIGGSSSAAAVQGQPKASIWL